MGASRVFAQSPKNALSSRGQTDTTEVRLRGPPGSSLPQFAALMLQRLRNYVFLRRCDMLKKRDISFTFESYCPHDM